MFDCLQYIEQWIPANGLYLQFYEKELQALRVIAKATQDGGERLESLVPLSETARETIEWSSERFQEGALPSLIINNRPQDDPLLNTMVRLFGDRESSLMILFLSTETTLFGSLALQADGNGRFQENHARLFGLLKDPFAVALSNARKHLETVRLKNLLADDNRYLQHEMQRLSGNRVIGEDFGLKPVMRLVRSVAHHDSPVLLLGETGVGKDVIAQAIHRLSPRNQGPFIAVNCGAIPSSLLDSELFGHQKGAFTGALSVKRGRFERAAGGTIFLDEIGELPAEAQIRLLRVLQNREIERLGGVQAIPVDIRVIAATNRNLEAMVKSGQFREDLWFRLNVFPVFIPPLRERKSDLPALLDYFLETKSKSLKLARIPELGSGAMQPLLAYDWPGNVRELENIVERALILNDGSPLRFEELLRGESLQPNTASPPYTQPQAFETVQKDYFQALLEWSGGRINGTNGAADVSGLNPSTLRNKLKKLGVSFGNRHGKS